MSLHSFALQERIYSTLNGDSTLGALITGVFDGVPDGQALPIVVIGEQTSNRFRNKRTIRTLHSARRGRPVAPWRRRRAGTPNSNQR